MHPPVEDVDGTPHRATSRTSQRPQRHFSLHSVAYDDEGGADVCIRQERPGRGSKYTLLKGAAGTAAKVSCGESKATLCFNMYLDLPS